MRRARHAVGPPFLTFALVILLSEITVRTGFISGYLLPAPSQVFGALRADLSELAAAAGDTAMAAATGLLLSAAIGTAAAVLFSSSRLLLRAFYPYAVFFQTVPIIAVAPILVIWFGYGMPTEIACAFIVSVFPVVANTLTGLLSTDPALVELFRLYGAGRLGTLLKLRLPYALPHILTGFRIAAGLAVIGAIVGEFIAGGGLGGIVDVARTQQRVDKVFAAVGLAAAIGLVFFATIGTISQLALQGWHASERAGNGGSK